MTLRRLRSILILMTALALLGACTQEPPTAAAPAAAPTPITAYEVQTRDLSRPLRLAAPVQPRALIRLAARTEGTLQEVLHEEGDRVERGQVLARLDVAEAKAELARAQAELAAARMDLKRIEELRRAAVATEVELQQAQVAMEVAQSNQALWQSRVAYGLVTAPEQSMIIARHVEPGEAVQAQQTLFELATMEQLVVRVGVSELDVVHLQPGQAIPLHLDALPQLQIEGRIRRIFPAAQGASRLITVEVALPPEAYRQGVRPGFLARIDTAIDPRPNTLVVPSAAIGAAQDEDYVLVIEDGALRRRTIERGISRSRWTEVRAGLEPGELILGSNPIDMREGQPVRVVAWHD